MVLAAFLFLGHSSLALAAAPSASSNAYAWLVRMGQTFQAGNYSLSLIRVYNQHFEPVAIEHGHVDGKELIYVNYLNGPEREVLHKDGMVTYFQHDEPAYSVIGARAVGPIPQAFISNIDALKANYRFVLGGRNRVMGRAAQLVRIEPKLDDRYSLWVWLDAAHGMLLRADIISPKGVPMEHIQIVSMQSLEQAPPVIERLAQLELPAAVPLLEPESPSEVASSTGQNGFVPKGFQLVGRDRHRLGVSNTLVDYRLYSDGVSSFSIYVGKALQGGAEKALVSQGATHLVTLAKGGIEVAVIGSLPKMTLQRIAEKLFSQLP